jgi:type III restriction enzyme
MYPDFVFFHNTDGGLRPSIVDPHGYHLADAAAKLRGLAMYAERHGGAYSRIDAVAKIGDRLLALDLKSETVRDFVAAEAEDGVQELFERRGGNYS